jgi:hypothetical protein
MADRPTRPDTPPSSGMSRWVKVTLILLVAVALLVVLVVAIGSGGIAGHQIPQHAPAADTVAIFSNRGVPLWS